MHFGKWLMWSLAYMAKECSDLNVTPQICYEVGFSHINSDVFGQTTPKFSDLKQKLKVNFHSSVDELSSDSGSMFKSLRVAGILLESSKDWSGLDIQDSNWCYPWTRVHFMFPNEKPTFTQALQGSAWPKALPPSWIPSCFSSSLSLPPLQPHWLSSSSFCYWYSRYK